MHQKSCEAFPEFELSQIRDNNLEKLINPIGLYARAKIGCQYPGHWDVHPIQAGFILYGSILNVEIFMVLPHNLRTTQLLNKPLFVVQAWPFA